MKNNLRNEWDEISFVYYAFVLIIKRILFKMVNVDIRQFYYSIFEEIKDISPSIWKLYF